LKWTRKSKSHRLTQMITDFSGSDFTSVFDLCSSVA
jgi:hypothetical protein